MAAPSRLENEYFSVADLAAHFGCTPAAIYHMIKTGRLPAYRIAGGMMRVKRSDVEAAIVPVSGAE